MENAFEIKKSDNDKQYVFGWANVSIRKDGEQIEDYQGDMIDPEELESAAYEHVLKFRSAGERHDPNFRNKGKLIESVVFTKEKLAAMGIPEGTVPLGWWVGYHIEDKDTWEKVKKGEYRMFSVEGQAQREPVEKSKNPVAKLFKALVEKFNPYHDKLGRFTWAGSGAMTFATITTKDPKKQWMADKAKEKAKNNLENDTPVRIITTTTEDGKQRTFHVMQDGKVKMIDAYGNKLDVFGSAEENIEDWKSYGHKVEVTKPDGKSAIAKPKPVDGDKSKGKEEAKKIPGQGDAMDYAQEDYKRYSFTSDQDYAIRRYTGSAYEDMNAHLRFGADTDGYTKKLIKDFSDAIDQTTIRESIVTYRGLGKTAMKTFMQEGGVSDANGLIGAVIHDKGFPSTSFNIDTAQGFAGSKCVLEITVPKGSKGLMPNGMSTFSNEAEVTLQKGAGFKISGTYTTKGSNGLDYTVLQCKYISP